MKNLHPKQRRSWASCHQMWKLIWLCRTFRSRRHGRWWYLERKQRNHGTNQLDHRIWRFWPNNLPIPWIHGLSPCQHLKILYYYLKFHKEQTSGQTGTGEIKRIDEAQWSSSSSTTWSQVANEELPEFLVLVNTFQEPKIPFLITSRVLQIQQFANKT